MNNNEETRIINPETKNMVEDSNVNNTEVKSKENGKRAASIASAFIGGATGAAAAEIADNYINNADKEVVVEEVANDTTTSTTSSSNTQQVVPEEEIIATPEEPESIPSDARLVSTEEPIENVQPASYNGEEEGEVRVVGVQAVENEDGSQAIVAGLELDGDPAMVVDVNSDGTINLFIHDDNGDGQISDDEVHDITADNISTQAIIDDAMAEQANQELYYASDDTPDYMNDADTGYIEV